MKKLYKTIYSKKEYRTSHLSREKSLRYEYQIYQKGLYDDIIWQEEKVILENEVMVLRQKQGAITYLDFGCGAGRITQFLEPHVDTSIGVDVSEAMLEIARPKLSKTRLLCADLTHIDILSGETFNLITAFRIFLNSGPEFSGRMLDVLVSKLTLDGILIFNMHGNFYSHRMITKFWYFIHGRTLNTTTYWCTRKLVESHKLQVMRWYGFGIVPKIFYRLFGARAMFICDSYLARIPFLKYISYNLIFVCKKTLL